ncbi:MAG: transglutaminase family protein, partial [Pseudomonadota bacterium]
LFAGEFVGPSSQSPRVDEARHETLYELEIAFAQLNGNKNPEPWLIDRLLRNLLVDASGNTHRTAFCIDKLYPVENPGNQLGLLELRSCAMSPHPRMSLLLGLLLRALVAWFWQEPYRGYRHVGVYDGAVAACLRRTPR